MGDTWFSKNVLAWDGEVARLGRLARAIASFTGANKDTSHVVLDTRKSKSVR